MTQLPDDWLENGGEVKDETRNIMAIVILILFIIFNIFYYFLTKLSFDSKPGKGCLYQKRYGGNIAIVCVEFPDYMSSWEY